MGIPDEETALADIFALIHRGIGWVEGRTMSSRLLQFILGASLLAGGGLAWYKTQWGMPTCLGVAATLLIVGAWAQFRAFIRRRVESYQRQRIQQTVRKLAYETTRFRTPDEAARFVVDQLKGIGVDAEIPPEKWYMASNSLVDPRPNPGSFLNDPSQM